MREIEWGSSFVVNSDLKLPKTTPREGFLTIGCLYWLGTWWHTRDGEIVEEIEGVVYPDCINWECFDE